MTPFNLVIDEKLRRLTQKQLLQIRVRIPQIREIFEGNKKFSRFNYSVISTRGTW